MPLCLLNPSSQQVMDSDSEGRASELFDYFKVGRLSGGVVVLNALMYDHPGFRCCGPGNVVNVVNARVSPPVQVLMIQGFLAIRKHADRILLLVEMMQGKRQRLARSLQPLLNTASITGCSTA